MVKACEECYRRKQKCVYERGNQCELCRIKGIPCILRKQLKRGRRRVRRKRRSRIPMMDYDEFPGLWMRGHMDMLYFYFDLHDRVLTTHGTHR